VEVEESLLQFTPIGCYWLYKAHEAVKAANRDGTVMNFLSFLMNLNGVFIQDAAAMLVLLFPNRINHPLLLLEVFGS
jgi:hypothetical protein